MYTFKKAERLNKKKIISRLFKRGSSFTVFPIKVIWLEGELDSIYPAQTLIAVSHRKIKKAVGRNRIKRQIRESWRQHKHQFYDFLTIHEKQCAVAFIFVGNTMVSSALLEKKIKQILPRLINALEKNNKTDNKNFL